MARLTVFGAGAMGTALAIHAARAGVDTALWANPFDQRALDLMLAEGRHPALPEHLPGELALFGPDRLEEAAGGCEVAVMGANSSGARSLARMVKPLVGDVPLLVSLAKGLEAETSRRMSEVYGEELQAAVVVVGGPCLAPELAQARPTLAVWAHAEVDRARVAGGPLATGAYQVLYTDDALGVELCAVIKNVGAIGLGFLDGMGKLSMQEFRNAKAALFTKAVSELATLVVALGGRAETALGPAGLGDVLVTSLGGRNRLYGELVGAGEDPATARQTMAAGGLTVEGVDSAKDTYRLAHGVGVELPYHFAVYRVLFEGAEPRSVLEVMG